MALLGLPKPLRERPILVWADSAGATHAFVDELVDRNLAFSIGFDLDRRDNICWRACWCRSRGYWRLAVPLVGFQLANRSTSCARRSGRTSITCHSPFAAQRDERYGSYPFSFPLRWTCTAGGGG
jgi:hypothetical protein